MERAVRRALPGSGRLTPARRAPPLRRVRGARPASGAGGQGPAGEPQQQGAQLPAAPTAQQLAAQGMEVEEDRTALSKFLFPDKEVRV